MKESFLRTNLVAALLAMALIASCTKSCGKENAGNEAVINVAIALPAESLDPRFATSATASRIAKLIYAPLFILGKDFAPVPFLAKDVEVVDETTFKINLREGLTFHDGSPLTAKDVVYTYTQLGSADVSSPHAEKFNYVDAITESGERQITFKLKQPFAPFLTDLVAIGIVSQKNCQGRSQQCRHEYVGSGPYRMKAWDSAKDMITLLPFDKWFEGRPAQSLVFRTIRDENTRMLELIGQKTDLVEGDISPQNSQELKKQDHLKVVELPSVGYSYMAINLRAPKDGDDKNRARYKTQMALSDKRVRQAISQAIDFDEIIEKVLVGSAVRVSGLIPNGHWAKDEALKPLAFDPKKAEALLDGAGFKREGQNQMRFSVTISTTAVRERQSIAMLYADYLKRIGIDAGIRVKDWGALYQDMKDGNFELFSAVWVPVTEPDLYYFVHHSSNIPNETNAGGNRHGYRNKEADRLIELGRATLDQRKRKVIYHEIERIMLEDLPYIPLWNENRIVVMNQNRLTGFIPDATGSLLDLRNATLKTATN